MTMHTTEAPPFESLDMVRSRPYVTGVFITATHDYPSSNEEHQETDAGALVPTGNSGRAIYSMEGKVTDLLSRRGLINIEVKFIDDHPFGSAVFVVNTSREAEDLGQSRIYEPAGEIDDSVDDLLSKALTYPLEDVFANLPESLAAKFRQISALPENWDSYGAPPIDEDALGSSAYIVQLGCELDLPLPAIAPGSDAGVGIEWDTEEGELYIDIAPENETTYALSRYGPEPEELEGTLENRGQISRILASFVRKE